MKHLKVLRYIDEVARAGSIRKAAEQLNLTASALNRRVQDIEQELGTQIFDRVARGVRLNAAGELLIRHIRDQLADTSRIRSQIEDLSGFRRGSVSIACSHALAYEFLPSEIAIYRRDFPMVRFEVKVLGHGEALRALVDFDVDLALVFRPATATEFQIVAAVEQHLVAIMRADHPLASAERLRLRDCARFPLALPDQTYGGRQMLLEATARKSFEFRPSVESNSFEFLRNFVRLEDAITFQIAVGSPTAFDERAGLVARPIDPRDVAPGLLALGQLRGRALTVAADKFSQQLARRLEAPAGSPAL
jgi:DNA-binding transcriptional LysR family regulator